MSAIIFCSSFSAKSTISSALYRSPFLDLLPEPDPPALAGVGDLLGLLAKIIQMKRPPHRKSFLQSMQGTPEPVEIREMLVDGPGHGLRREPGGEIERDVEGRHERVALEHRLFQELAEGLPPFGSDPGHAALHPAPGFQPLERVVDRSRAHFQKVLQALVDGPLEVIARAGLLLDEAQEADGVDRIDTGRHTYYLNYSN